MLRRQVRLRKEYLYRKSLEDQERRIADKKKKLKRALDEGKPIPTELRKDESELRKLMKFDDEEHNKVSSKFIRFCLCSDSTIGLKEIPISSFRL